MPNILDRIRSVPFIDITFPRRNFYDESSDKSHFKFFLLRIRVIDIPSLTRERIYAFPPPPPTSSSSDRLVKYAVHYYHYYYRIVILSIRLSMIDTYIRVRTLLGCIMEPLFFRRRRRRTSTAHHHVVIYVIRPLTPPLEWVVKVRFFRPTDNVCPKYLLDNNALPTFPDNRNKSSGRKKSLSYHR